MNSDGTNQHPIQPKQPMYSVQRLDWLPDNRRLIIETADYIENERYHKQLYLLDTETGEANLLIDAPSVWDNSLIGDYRISTGTQPF